MLSAFLFGMIASSALVIGGVIGAYLRPSQRLVAMAVAFASGSLITALATDLFAEPFRTGGVWPSGIGLLAGAAAVVVADGLLDRYIEGAGSDVSGFAILAAVTLDGVPENMALGLASPSCRHRGRGLWRSWSPSSPPIPPRLWAGGEHEGSGPHEGLAIVVWTATAVILAAAVVVGNAALSGASEKSLSVLLSFAGGAVLASLADTLMPPAYREGGKSVAFATAAGFFVSFAISEL